MLIFKSDNILVSYANEELTNVKLIDFGSSFLFDSATCISMSTPEYLAPEVLDYLENKGKPRYNNGISDLFDKMHVWSYDMWSIGALLLEIITGFPLWLSLKGRIKTKAGKSIFGTGIFGVSGRDSKKILQKQKKLLKSNLRDNLKKYMHGDMKVDYEFMDLLTRLLNFTPAKRISP
jgi:serine/threonine protein kinase